MSLTPPAPTIVALVPARGGSKGVVRKNLRPLGGRPLIAYSIEAGLRCRMVNRCLVSTEDPEIAEVAREWGAELITRPSSLATDNARTHDVVLHALEQLNKGGSSPSYLVLLQPTSPFRHAGHVQACLEAMLAAGAASAISVSEMDHHPYKALRLVHGLLEPLMRAEYLDLPRQLLPPVYRQNGAIYVVQTEPFQHAGTFLVPPAMPYVMSAEDGHDIDTEADFVRAEAILLARAVADRFDN